MSDWAKFPQVNIYGAKKQTNSCFEGIWNFLQMVCPFFSIPPMFWCSLGTLEKKGPFCCLQDPANHGSGSQSNGSTALCSPLNLALWYLYKDSSTSCLHAECKINWCDPEALVSANQCPLLCNLTRCLHFGSGKSPSHIFGRSFHFQMLLWLHQEKNQMEIGTQSFAFARESALGSHLTPVAPPPDFHRNEKCKCSVTLISLFQLNPTQATGVYQTFSAHIN